MASLDAEEALLKKKLEDTENLEERREIRKQLRELRNRKFEEEIKKVTANDYRPGRTKSALSNGVDSSLSSVGRKESVEKKVDEEDVHGINHLETEEELQALLNETPFTETDKRKKIRARIREIRNHKLGLGDPLIIKRPSREEKQKEESKAEKEKENETNHNETNSRDVKVVANDDDAGVSNRSSYSSRSSYRSRQTDEEPYSGRSVGRRSNNDTENAVRETSVTKNRHGYGEDKESAKANEDDAKVTGVTEVKDNEVESEYDVEVNAGIQSNEENEVLEEEEVKQEEIESDPEDNTVNGYGEDRGDDVKDEQEDDLDNKKELESRSRGSSSYVSDKNEEEFEDKNFANDEDYIDDDGPVDDIEELKDDDASYDEREENDEEDEIRGDDLNDVEEDGLKDNEDRQECDSGKRDRGYSAEDEEYYSEDEAEDKAAGEPEIEDKPSKREEYSDEEDYSESDDGNYDEEEEKDDSYQDSPSKSSQRQQDYSDDYSEGYSDHTATDEGSSVSGKRFDDDQDLAGCEFERKSAPRGQGGPSYVAKIDEGFKKMEPALADGKSFKELLKKSDKTPIGKSTAGKKGAEQVDFRTVLRAADKPKKLGEKQASNVEQVDFRNLLQRKVKTKTLADKDTGAEQVDFRTVLKAGAVPSEKKEAPARKTSNAEQLDFRNVLKKQPSVKSRKLSVEDKNEIIRNIRAGKDSTKNEADSSSAKPGRQSLEALRQGGGVGKAKDELNRNLKEDADGEKTQRKAGRPSLDALKQSGDLGKTEDKRGVFEKGSKSKKAPAPVPPKPSAKAKVNSNIVEKVEEEIIEEPEIVDEVEQEPEIEGDQVKANDVEESAVSTSKQRATSIEISSKERMPRKTSIEVSSKEKVEDAPRKSSIEISSRESSEKPRSRRRNNESARSEARKEEQRTEARSEARTEAQAAQESDEKRSPTKSGDKRARNRRLRQDQSEALKSQSDDGKKEEVDKTAEVQSKSSSIERVAVVQSTAARPTVQVILSTKSSAEKGKAEDSDDESIGARRNRRRLLRKESVEEQDSGRVSVRTIKKEQPTEEKKDVETKEGRGASTGSSAGDETDGKPSRVTSRREIANSSRANTENEKSKDAEEDPAKARKAKVSSLDARLAERRRQRAMENREKQQKVRNSRKAFKDKLESNAPATNGSASPSVQRANSNMTKLLHWCQRMTDGFPNVSVTNFTTSWKDGLAFCALLHNFLPEKVPFDDLSPKKPRENFEIAFSAATEEGVPELLEVEDMVRMECPDPKSVITYINSIYQVFVADRR